MNPHESYLMAQIEALLKMGEQLAKFPLTGPVKPGIEEALTRMEKIVEKYDQALNSVPKKERTLTPHEEKMKIRWAQLGMTAAGLGAALNIAFETYKKRNPTKLGKNTQKSIQKRQRKFKGVGGHDKWKKL